MKLARFFSIWLVIPVFACMVLSSQHSDLPFDFLSMGFSILIIQVFSLVYAVTHDD